MKRPISGTVNADTKTQIPNASSHNISYAVHSTFHLTTRNRNFGRMFRQRRGVSMAKTLPESEEVV